MYTLYIREGCPFCEKVRGVINEYEIEATFKDIADPAVAEELVDHGGKSQVPYLVDSERGVAMYESEDIISYLVTRVSGDAENDAPDSVDENLGSSDDEGGGE